MFGITQQWLKTALKHGDVAETAEFSALKLRELIEPKETFITFLSLQSRCTEKIL